MNNLQSTFEYLKNDSRGSRSFAFIVTAVFLLIAGFSTFNHEMWRDEIQPWLLARDSPSFTVLAENTKYEGHPLLWYVVLWPLTRVTHHPEAIQFVNLIISGATIFLIARFAPGPRWIRILAIFGYFPIYEYGTIARNYSLGLLLIVAYCAIFPKRRLAPLLPGLVLAFAANTSVHALILATAALAVLFAEVIIRPPETKLRALTWTSIATGIAGVAAAIWQIWPPPDSGYAESWNTALNLDRLRHVLATITSAYAPVRVSAHEFFPTQIPPWPETVFSSLWFLGFFIVAVATLALLRRPVALAYFALSNLGLLALFYLKFIGYLRHHGFLFICFATSLWLAKEIAPKPVVKPLEQTSDRAWRLLKLMFPLILVVQVIAAGIAVAAERANIFSGAKAAAALLRSKELDHLTLLGEPDYAVSPILGYLDKKSAYYPAGDRYGSFIIWDQTRLGSYNIWSVANRLSATEQSPVLVVLGAAALSGAPPAPDHLVPRLKLIGCVEAKLVLDEGYCIFILLPS